ncbi:MAG: type III secretion system translocon subunit SctB [Deltaproteobacteria bacterium]|jgi:hypothetical protein|nr:type III secretion system translocon subunit SctB [Deltaproteobacteria bacterium]
MALNLDTAAAAADIRTRYGLNESQFDQLKSDVGKLNGQQRAAISDEFVLIWKALNTSGSSLGDVKPRLTGTAMGTYMSLTGWTSSTSFDVTPGATMMAVLTEILAEQRKQDRDQIVTEADSISKSMMNQADNIREKAAIQLAIGCVTGAISIIGGLASMYSASSNLDALDKKVISEAQLGTKNVELQGAQSALQGANAILNAVGEYYGQEFDAANKELDAGIEQIRAIMESLRSLDQSLGEVIQKAISSFEAIQQGLNQARSRILG